MPITTAVGDSLPLIVLSVGITTVGWMAKDAYDTHERLSALETETSVYKEDVREIKAGVFRLEGYLLEGTRK